MSMLTEWYEKLIDFAKQKVDIVFWFFLCSTILLFVPDRYLKIIHLEELANLISPITGLIFLLSGVLIFINVINFSKKYIQEHRKKHQEIIERKDLLNQLEQLYSINELKTGFNSQQDCIVWSNDVAPFLRFNEQYYRNFITCSHQLNNMNISGTLGASLEGK